MQKQRVWAGVVALAALMGASGRGVSMPAAVTSTPGPEERVSDVLTYATDRTGGGPLVQVTLNDRTRATFLLDTGTSDCAVTSAMAARLGLTPRATAQAAAPLIMNGGLATTVPLTIQLGRFRFPRYPTLVIRGGRFREVLGRPLDGILGVGLLRHFALILAPQSHILTLLTPGKLPSVQIQAWGFKRASALPLTRANNGTYWVLVEFANGEHTTRESLAIDTGAGTSVLSHAAADALDLVPVQRGLSVPFGNGTFVGDLASIPAVTLGTVPGETSPTRSTLTWHDGAFLYPSLPETGVGTPHVLGMNVLSHCSVLLDFPGGTLYLQPLQTGAAASR